MKKMLSIAEFGATYGVSRSRAYELLAGGELSAVKVGRSTRIPVEAAEAWKCSLPAFQVGNSSHHIGGKQAEFQVEEDHV